MAGLALDDLFDGLFYEGGGLSSLVPSAFPIAIDGHPYMVDVRKCSRRTLPSTSEAIDQSSEPGEQSLSREGFWPRSQSRFDLGAGQAFFDEDGASRRRWWTSKGIDPWMSRHSLQLLPDTELKAGTNAPSSSASKLLSVGGYLYVADGTNLKLTADPTSAAPTWVVIAAGGTIADIATDGVNVYVAITGATIQKTAVGASSMTVWGTATAQPDILAFANGRLLAADANVLQEIAATGIAATIRTDPRGATATWASIVGTPDRAFAALNAGGRGEVYALTIDDVSASLGAPVLAAELPMGETVHTLAYYGSTVLIGTSAGLRAAPIVNGGLDLGQRIDTLVPVRCFSPEAEFVWFGWTNFDATSTGVGRVDLATNTSEDTFVPAYASDVMATAQGNVLGLARHASRTYFTVAGAGLYGSTATLVASGTFNTGWIRFSSLVPKVFSGIQVGHEPLVGTVAATAIFEDGTTRALGTSSVVGSTISELFDTSGRGVAVQVQLTLTRATSTTGPTVRYWTLNALPAPRRVDEILLAIKFAPSVTDLRGTTHAMDPLAEYEFLTSIRSDNRFVTLQEMDRSELVRVDNVAIPEGEIDHWMEPAHRAGQPTRLWYATGIMVVRLLSREN